MSGLTQRDPLPKGWCLARFNELLHRVERKIIIEDADFYNCVGVRWYGLGAFIRENMLGMNITRKQQWVIKSGDIVYNKLFAWKNAFAIVDDSVDGCIVSDKFPTYEVDASMLNLNFLHYYFRTANLGRQALALSKGGAAISKLTLNPPQFWDLTIPLPPLEEQHRIVARIEELVAKIEEARELRREAMEETESLLESSIDSIFHTINGVEKKLLKSLTSKIGSGSTPTGGRNSYPSSGIPFIRSLNVRMRQFTREGLAFIDEATHENMRGTQVRPNDVLLNITGASIGRVACVPSDIVEGNVSQHVAIIRPVEALNSRYLLYWLSQPSIQESINSEQKGATRQGFTKAQIETFKVPLPSLAEQQRIVTYLDSLQAKVDILKREQAEISAELDALLPSILDKAFKGEL